MTGVGGGGGGGGGGYGVSAIELEKTLKKSLKAQRDTEVRLQLQLQKGVQLNGNTTRLLQENEMLKSQVRKPSPPSFAGPSATSCIAACSLKPACVPWSFTRSQVVFCC